MNAPGLATPLHRLACDAWASDPAREALVYAWLDGRVDRFTFADVAARSRALAGRLSRAGVGGGDRVAVLLPQHPAVPIIHLALSRLGAISVPLSPLFGPEAIEARMGDSAPRLAFAAAGREKDFGGALPVETVDARWLAALRTERLLPEGDESAEGGDLPLTLIYTSGTTGRPKGALLPHRVIPGRLPGFRLAHDPMPSPGDRFWSPADWAWIGGLHDALLAPWALGVPVFAYEREGHFEPERAYALCAAHGVRNAFLPPTALKLFMRSGARPAAGFALRSLHTAGEPLAPAAFEWARAAWGVAPVELYGLTECAFVLGHAPGLAPPRAGVTGRPYPGHEVAVLREDLSPTPDGELGELCVRAGSPTMMLGYWRGPDEPPRLPLAQGWLRTRDLAVRARDGAIAHRGRQDDVIKTSGIRLGPGEVEACLLAHPAVAEVGVVGVPDEVRGEVVVAFVKLASGHEPSEALAEALREFVKLRLAAHAQPRRVAFVAALPLTPSGKIIRSELRAIATTARRHGGL